MQRIRKVPKTIKKVRFVPKIIDVQELKFDEQRSQVTKSRWVKR